MNQREVKILEEMARLMVAQTQLGIGHSQVYAQRLNKLLEPAPNCDDVVAHERLATGAPPAYRLRKAMTHERIMGIYGNVAGLPDDTYLSDRAGPADALTVGELRWLLAFAQRNKVSE